MKDSDKHYAGPDDLPQGHRAQDNLHLPEKIAQEIGSSGCQQAVFNHRPLNPRDASATHLCKDVRLSGLKTN